MMYNIKNSIAGISFMLMFVFTGISVARASEVTGTLSSSGSSVPVSNGGGGNGTTVSGTIPSGASGNSISGRVVGGSASSGGGGSSSSGGGNGPIAGSGGLALSAKVLTSGLALSASTDAAGTPLLGSMGSDIANTANGGEVAVASNSGPQGQQGSVLGVATDAGGTNASPWYWFSSLLLVIIAGGYVYWRYYRGTDAMNRY